MKFSKRPPLKFWVILASLIVILLISIFRTFHNYELLFYDLRFRLRPAQKISSDIIIIEISDDTLKNLGKWPLPRDFHASLVDVLKDYGARMIVFDVLFSEPTLYDDVFSQAIKRAGNVYLPLAFYIDTAQKKTRCITESKVILADIIDNLKNNTQAIGHINTFVDSDGKVRKVPLFIKYNQTIFPQLGLQVACDWLGLNTQNLEFKSNRVIIDNRLSLPVLNDGTFFINYPDKWVKSFKHLSYFEILKSFADKKHGIVPHLDLSLIKDKVCFIGLTATGTSDLRPVPLENIYPMLGLQASVFNSIIQKKFIRDAGLFFNSLINIFIFIFSLILCLKFTPLRAFIGSIILGLVYFTVSTGIFIFGGIWMDLFLPLLLIVLTYIGTTTYRFFNEVRKRELLEKELDIARTIQRSFLPEDIEEFCGLTISAFIQPAKFVAGDLYDIFIIDDKKIGIFIGDVSGKGVPASLIMAQTISLFRIFSRQYFNCPEVLSRLNKELYGKFAGRFVTCLYMIVDTKEERIRVSSAGQSPLLVLKNDGNIWEVELHAELPLGITEDTPYQEVTFDIEKDDKIVLFTDGLVEARNIRNQELGIKDIKDIILKNARLSSEKLLEVIKGEVSRFSSSAAQHDDITLIVLAKKWSPSA